MRLYELTYLILPDLKEEDLKSLEERIVGFLQDKGGVLENIKKPKEIKLGYPIKKNSTKYEKAYLATIEFYLNPSTIEEVALFVKKEPQILRHIIVTKKAPKIEIKKPQFIPSFSEKQKQEKVELADIDEKLKEILEE